MSRTKRRRNLTRKTTVPLWRPSSYRSCSACSCRTWRPPHCVWPLRETTPVSARYVFFSFFAFSCSFFLLNFDFNVCMNMRLHWPPLPTGIWLLSVGCIAFVLATHLFNLFLNLQAIEVFRVRKNESSLMAALRAIATETIRNTLSENPDSNDDDENDEEEDNEDPDNEAVRYM